jgi:hypothetical protein
MPSFRGTQALYRPLVLRSLLAAAAITAAAALAGCDNDKIPDISGRGVKLPIRARLSAAGFPGPGLVKNVQPFICGQVVLIQL